MTSDSSWSRGAWVPAVLLLIAAISGSIAAGGAFGAGSVSSGGVKDDEAELRLSTPVLSVRRAPELLSRTVAHIRLGNDLDAAMSPEALGPAADTSCLAVEEGDDTIYGRHPDLKLVPASTLKVLTGMAALGRMGNGFHYVTEVKVDRPVAGGVLDGPLWLVGAGDPLLSTKAYADSFRNQPQVYTSIDVLADRIVEAGIREIRGGVIGDESRYDAVRYFPGWKQGYITDNEVGPVSALVVNDNFAQYRPLKTIAGTPPVHGAQVLTDLLRGRGVVVADPGQGVAPEGATPVASVTSSPMPDIVGQLLRESDNMTAEMLTKEMGRRYGAGGTWEEGTKVIRETVAMAGLPAEGYAASDGSGLSVSNRLSCALLMDALDLAGRGGAVTAGFAVAGQTGTLAQRFKGSPAEGRLRAKTGSLNFVAGLVGFVDAADDRSLEFALIANGLSDRTRAGRLLQERVGAILATYPKAPPAANLEPLPPRPGGMAP